MTVLEAARAAVASGPVCDPCLGRLFADRSFGLTNRERGRSARVALALEDDEPYEPPEEPCWVCEGECDRFDVWAERAATALQGYDFATYQVGTSVPPLLEENDRLLREDAGLDPEAGELLKSEFNREVGKRLGQLTGTEVDFERPDVQVRCDLATDEVDVQVNSAFVYGRYRKLERDIPQTEWPCRECNETGIKRGEECPGCDGTGYRYDRSVEELTAPVVLEAMDGESATFHGAGREDVDALMLGDGRPFVIEVDEPRVRDVDVDALEAEIDQFADGAVEVEGLRRATYDMVERVKELEQDLPDGRGPRRASRRGDVRRRTRRARRCDDPAGDPAARRPPAGRSDANQAGLRRRRRTERQRRIGDRRAERPRDRRRPRRGRPVREGTRQRRRGANGPESRGRTRRGGDGDRTRRPRRDRRGRTVRGRGLLRRLDVGLTNRDRWCRPSSLIASGTGSTLCDGCLPTVAGENTS